MKNLEILAEVINTNLAVDIKSKSRAAENIDEVRMYFAIVKELYLSSISRSGKTINRDHATGLYHVKQHLSIYATDKFYSNLYNIVKSDFLSKAKIHTESVANEHRKLAKYHIEQAKKALSK